jgi:hypothetical protein
MTNAFRDAHEILSGPPTFWVFSVEDVFNPSVDSYQRIRLSYNWRVDVYCFIFENALCICFGHPDVADRFYTIDLSLLSLYRHLIQTLQPTLDYLAKEGEID